MNETLSVIKSRRSIRNFKSDPIPNEQLAQILEAGQFAPSGMNEQPWHFTVIRNRDIIKKLNRSCVDILMRSGNEAVKKRLSGKDPDTVNLFYDAPVAIVVSGDTSAIAPELDCALAIGNMLLAAEALQIGSCWIHALSHLSAIPEGRDLLTQEGIVPDGNTVVGTAVFGYKTQNAAASPRKENTISYID